MDGPGANQLHKQLLHTPKAIAGASPWGVCAVSLQTTARKAAQPWQTYLNSSQASGSSEPRWPLLTREEKRRLFDQRTVVGDLAHPCVSWRDRPGGRWEGRHQRCYLASTSHHRLNLPVPSQLLKQVFKLQHHSGTSTFQHCSATPAARKSCPGNTDNRSIQHHLNFHFHPRESFFSRKVQQNLHTEYKKPYIPLKESQVFRLGGFPKAFIEDENFQWSATMNLKLWRNMWPKLKTFFFVFSSVLLDTSYGGLCLYYPLICTWSHCKFLY